MNHDCFFRDFKALLVEQMKLTFKIFVMVNTLGDVERDCSYITTEVLFDSSLEKV